MRLTIAIGLLATLGMIALCHWEVSRVSTTIEHIRLDSDSFGSTGSSQNNANAGRGNNKKQPASSLKSLETSEELREPLYPSDQHKRERIAEVFAEASARLRQMLVDSRKANGHASAADPEKTEASVFDSKQESRHWAFRRLQQITMPKSPSLAHASNPIDVFIRKRLAAQGLELNDEASPGVLRRRLSFDLRGLPPAMNDKSYSDYNRLVDRYLDDEAHGEHWARMWLDVARFADSDGYESDELRPDAYPYRDFVIWALNEDLPFNHFVEWQIAGDELAPNLPPAIAATGFLAAAPHNTFMPQPSERYDELHDMISTMGSAILGLSVGCARCHDHFYDPISTVEYYRLVAILEGAERTHRYLAFNEDEETYADLAQNLVDREYEAYEMLVARVQESKIAKLNFTDEEKELLRKSIDPSPDDTAFKRQQDLLARCGGCLRADGKDFVDGLQPLPESAARYAQLQREIAELKETLPLAPPQGLVITGSDVVETHVLGGGSLKRKGELVGPGFLTALTSSDIDWNEDAWRRWAFTDDASTDTKPRAALARWMTDVKHGAGPLLARVIVNRLWQQYFGQGLVATPNDFGAQGEQPTHPDLLEWLANELVENDWQLKHIHRLIVTSATYRQNSVASDARLAADSDNRLVSRYRRKRLTAEMFRDSVLATTGSLNREMYGPSIFPPIPNDAIYTDDDELDAKWPTDIEEGPTVWRRSIYVALRRSNTVPMLDLFDAADGGRCQGKRNVTTVPLQALALFNAPFIRTQAVILAERLGEHSNDLGEQVSVLYQLALQRQPTDEERLAIYDTIDRRRAEASEVYDIDVMTDVCHVIFMLNEFIYLD